MSSNVAIVTVVLFTPKKEDNRISLLLSSAWSVLRCRSVQRQHVKVKFTPLRGRVL